MSVYFGSNVFGEVRSAGVHGRSGIGVSELAFSLAWSIHPTRSEVFTVFGTSVWVSVQPEGEGQPVLLGHALPETAWCNETRPHPSNEQLLYRLVLPSPQLLALEHLRQGRGLLFTLDVRGNSQCSQGVGKFNQTLTMPVTVSDWSRILREANASDILLVGVNLPAADLAPNFTAAIEIVRKANRHLTEGNYSVSVAECRLALESLWKAANLETRAVSARQQFAKGADRKNMVKRDRALALGEAIRHFCHNAHHVGVNAVPEDFGRLEAALVVGATAALISSLVTVPDLVEPSIPQAAPFVLAKFVSLPPILTSTPKQTKAAPTPIDEKAARLLKAKAHLKKNAKNRPATMATLRSAIASLFANKLSAAEVEELISELKRTKSIEEKAKKLSYPGV
jgi:hypothetical protein